MKSENIIENRVKSLKDMEYVDNNTLYALDPGDGIVMNDVDPEICVNAETFFKVINDYAKSIQKQRSVHSTESVENKKIA